MYLVDTVVSTKCGPTSRQVGFYVEPLLKVFHYLDETIEDAELTGVPVFFLYRLYPLSSVTPVKKCQFLRTSLTGTQCTSVSD